MKVVILAGWLGTRLSEETALKPKPMVEIWWMPIIWHIMKLYSYYGYTEFVIALWYKGEYIKQWFSNYYLHQSDVTFNLKENSMQVHNNNSEDWKVTLVDTWLETQTGWRLKKIIEKWYIEEDSFMMTYGDGLSNIDISKLVDTYKSQDTLATLTATAPSSRFWKLTFDGSRVIDFWEKKDNVDQYINGWYMVLNKKIIDYIDDYSTPFESSPLENLAKKWELSSYKHDGFWFAMDTLHHKNTLEKMWSEKKAPWKVYS